MTVLYPTTADSDKHENPKHRVFSNCSLNCPARFSLHTIEQAAVPFGIDERSIPRVIILDTPNDPSSQRSDSRRFFFSYDDFAHTKRASHCRERACRSFPGPHKSQGAK